MYASTQSNAKRHFQQSRYLQQSKYLAGSRSQPQVLDERSEEMPMGGDDIERTTFFPLGSGESKQQQQQPPPQRLPPASPKKGWS